MIYYGDHDPEWCAGLRVLMAGGHIGEGTVHEQDIRKVEARDLAGYERVHLFAGVGGWELALRLAGWDSARPVWTGSCPCQPFSTAGRRKGEADERHLWPEMFRLVRECRPDTVFGEQVASKDGLRWLDGVCADLEGAGYAVGACDLCAAGAGQEAEGRVVRGDSAAWEPVIVGAPIIRQRLFWVATRHLAGPGGQGLEERRVQSAREERAAAERSSDARHLARAEKQRRQSWTTNSRGSGEGIREERAWGGPSDDSRAGVLDGAGGERRQRRQVVAAGRVAHGADAGRPQGADGFADPGEAARAVGVAGSDGRPGDERGPRPRDESVAQGAGGDGFWSAFDVLPCTDGKARRVEPGSFPLVAWVPRGLGRSGRLRGYGNAICPQAAAAFIQAFLESEGG